MNRCDLALLALIPMMLLGVTCRTADAEQQYPGLAKFYRTLEKGGRQKVAFFGSSITWGATASDPMKTSYRALVSKYFATNHPDAHLESIDAAIGGQPSKLGVFRMDRDVVPYQPNLVFIEFAVNDGGAADSVETMEGIVRKLRKALPDAQVVILIIGAGWEYSCASHDGHVKVADYYGLPYVDIYRGVKERVEKGLSTKDVLFDGCHASDNGYRIYTEIIIEELNRQRAMKGAPRAYPEKPMSSNRFETAWMVEISKLPDLGGWKPAIPSVVGTWFDHQPSRWQSSAVAPARDNAVLATDIECAGIGLYYELTPNGNPMQVVVDGNKTLDIDTKNPCQEERVMWQFAMLQDGVKKRRIELVASKAEKVKAAYFLCTK